LPSATLTNDALRARFAALVRDAEQRSLSKVWAVRDAGALTDFELEMQRYLDDPFRGTVERRVLAPGETSESLMVRAARSTLEAAELSPGQLDAIIGCSFPSGRAGIGEATFVARALGASCAAFNVESACASALVALEVAAAMVAARRFRRVLVVTACTYSRVTAPDDTLGWTVGDGAAGFIVDDSGRGAVILGAHSTHTAESCDALWYESDPSLEGGLRMVTGPAARDSLRDVSERTVDVCCHHAASAAGVSLEEIERFVPNTPTAWFADFFARKLGVRRDRVIDTYPRFANIGPALWPTALHDAATRRAIGSDDRVMLFAVGSVASAGAMVLRWGDVALGPSPS
jgi:3-oxoacyl-[acyl-carrier-protein] synthase-3